MKIGVFYSWESDRRGNRDLIQAAAEEAALRISADETIKVEPALDRDTQNTSGSPAIADTILSKIRLSDLFLCDVTIVSEAGEQRPTPNPNVLIELGYAVAKIGWERIICVMNEAHGGPRKLPFDLRHRRWPIRYRLSDKADADRVKQVRDKLSEEIELQIRIAIENGIIPARLNPKDIRVAAKLESALNSFLTGSITSMATSYNFDFTDLRLTNDLSKKIVRKILANTEFVMALFEYTKLISPSSVSSEGKSLPWFKVLYDDLRSLEGSCSDLAERYYERDDQLIAVIEDLQTTAKHLRGILISVGIHYRLGQKRTANPVIEPTPVVQFLGDL